MRAGYSSSTENSTLNKKRRKEKTSWALVLHVAMWGVQHVNQSKNATWSIVNNEVSVTSSSIGLSFLPAKVQSSVQLPFIGSTDTWGNGVAMAGAASTA
mmetsp:Transcript_26518/g.37247  ORF Transcript_26518/g.37247 Transcript_26518/m.37247 type:complete len:99 (-) Transcript_26518:1649-1945(-)